MASDRMPARRGRGMGAVKPGPAEVVQFAKHLRGLQERLQLTQEDLARQLHVSPSTLSRYMSGERVPDREFVCEIYRLLGEPADIKHPGGEFKSTLELLFAAKKRKEPLRHRIWMLELAEAGLKNEIDEAKAITAGLEKRIQEEVDARLAVETELNELRTTLVQRAVDQSRISELEEIQRLAEERIQELEDLLKEQRSLVVVLEEERKLVTSSLGYASREVFLNDLVRGDNRTDDDLKHHVLRKVNELFDEGHAEQADHLLESYSRGLDCGQFVDFLGSMFGQSRKRAGLRLLYKEAAIRTVRELVKIMRLLWAREQQHPFGNFGSEEIDFILDCVLSERDPEVVGRLLNALLESDSLNGESFMEKAVEAGGVDLFTEVYGSLSHSARDIYVKRLLRVDDVHSAALVIGWLFKQNPEAVHDAMHWALRPRSFEDSAKRIEFYRNLKEVGLPEDSAVRVLRSVDRPYV